MSPTRLRQGSKKALKIAEMLENFTGERFRERVSKLLFGVDVENINLFEFILLTDEIVFGLNVFCSLVKFGVLH